jgi:hypothetical protein
MIFRPRPNIPNCLSEINSTSKKSKWFGVTNEVAWGMMDAAKLNDPKKSNNLSWHTYNGVKVNTILEPLLIEMNQGHCSFCDMFPLEEVKGTIEHFEPKSLSPLLSHTWTNLFYCCHGCQEKGDDFSRLLLKPDEIGYNFDFYFVCVTKNQKIELRPNRNRSLQDQARADKTIELYGLNNFNRPKGRFREYNKFVEGKHSIDDFPYRYLFL